MTKREKREQAMRRKPAQVRFEQLHDLFVDNGFRYSINGSHYNYEHGRYRDIQPGIVKPHGGMKHVLPVYVKKRSRRLMSYSGGTARWCMMRREPRYHPIYTRRIAIPDEAWQRAARPYAIIITHDDENGYVAQAEEFPWLVAAEETPEAAESSLRHAIALAIASAMRRGHPIPGPHRVPA